MSSLKALFFCAGLALFALGCSNGMDATTTEAERAEFNAKMDADMAAMTGKVSEKPGEGTAAPDAK